MLPAQDIGSSSCYIYYGKSSLTLAEQAFFIYAGAAVKEELSCEKLEKGTVGAGDSGAAV